MPDQSYIIKLARGDDGHAPPRRVIEPTEQQRADAVRAVRNYLTTGRVHAKTKDADA